jgi:hypothetical protein
MKEISLNQWHVVGGMAAFIAGVYLGLLRLLLWMGN